MELDADLAAGFRFTDGTPLTAAEGPLPKQVRDMLTKARTAWLKNTEVVELLMNFRAYGFRVGKDTPHRPSGGTLYLFNRRVTRFFRRDGHNWRKKADGRTIRETHEKLKVGNKEMLNCYYAHADQDEHLQIPGGLQRRCYWMLEGDDSIVLVHYLAATPAARLLQSGQALPQQMSHASSSSSLDGIAAGAAPRMLRAGSAPAAPLSMLEPMASAGSIRRDEEGRHHFTITTGDYRPAAALADACGGAGGGAFESDFFEQQLQAAIAANAADEHALAAGEPLPAQRQDRAQAQPAAPSRSASLPGRLGSRAAPAARDWLATNVRIVHSTAAVQPQDPDDEEELREQPQRTGRSSAPGSGRASPSPPRPRYSHRTRSSSGFSSAPPPSRSRISPVRVRERDRDRRSYEAAARYALELHRSAVAAEQRVMPPPDPRRPAQDSFDDMDTSNGYQQAGSEGSSPRHNDLRGQLQRGYFSDHTSRHVANGGQAYHSSPPSPSYSYHNQRGGYDPLLHHPDQGLLDSYGQDLRSQQQQQQQQSLQQQLQQHQQQAQQARQQPQQQQEQPRGRSVFRAPVDRTSPFLHHPPRSTGPPKQHPLAPGAHLAFSPSMLLPGPPPPNMPGATSWEVEVAEMYDGDPTPLDDLSEGDSPRAWRFATAASLPDVNLTPVLLPALPPSPAAAPQQAVHPEALPDAVEVEPGIVAQRNAATVTTFQAPARQMNAPLDVTLPSLAARLPSLPHSLPEAPHLDNEDEEEVATRGHAPPVLHFPDLQRSMSGPG